MEATANTKKGTSLICFKYSFLLPTSYVALSKLFNFYRNRNNNLHTIVRMLK